MNKALISIAGLLFCGGLIIAGSDGQHFPLINFIGVSMVALAGFISNRILT